MRDILRTWMGSRHSLRLAEGNEEVCQNIPDAIWREPGRGISHSNRPVRFGFSCRCTSVDPETD